MDFIKNARFMDCSRVKSADVGQQQFRTIIQSP